MDGNGGAGPSTEIIVPIPPVTAVLFSGTGPLSSFWARIQFAYALQLIGNKTYTRLEWVRSIRNEFAHTYGPKDFDDPRIRSQMDEMIGAESRQPEDEELMRLPRSSVKRGDFIRRLAFMLSISKLGGRISRVKSAIGEGVNLREFVRHMEEKHDW